RCWSLTPLSLWVSLIPPLFRRFVGCFFVTSWALSLQGEGLVVRYSSWPREETSGFCENIAAYENERPLHEEHEDTKNSGTRKSAGGQSPQGERAGPSG